jgi:hypothetical protein
MGALRVPREFLDLGQFCRVEAALRDDFQISSVFTQNLNITEVGVMIRHQRPEHFAGNVFRASTLQQPLCQVMQLNGGFQLLGGPLKGSCQRRQFTQLDLSPDQ